MTTTDTNIQNLIINELTQEQYDSITPNANELYMVPDDSESSRNIGQIIPSTIPLTDAGLHLLDGALIDGSGIYSAFVTYVAGLVSTYPDLFVTESAWQTAVTTYDVCGKFVYDSTNNTVRLPKVTGIIEGTTDVTALGDLVEAGLPNITGSFTAWDDKNMSAPTGCFSEINHGFGSTISSGSSSGWTSFPFDASSSSSIYGNSTTVQPQTIKVLYYIVVATSTKTDIQVDIDEVATDLNNKVDKSDLQEVQCVVETYMNGTSWYRVYSDGWCEQGGQVSPTNAQAVNLLKAYANTSYSVIATSNHKDTSNRRWASAGINSSSQIWVMTSSSATGASTSEATWVACGYIS